MDDVRVRERCQHEQEPIDAEILGWLARFRFCSADVLELRFATRARSLRKRLARLERAGLVISRQAHLAAPKLYAIGPAGRTLLGLPHRHPPRWDVQVTHELAIATLAARIETGRPDARVLSERDCRRADAAGAATYSVVCQQRNGMTRRWPDLVVEQAGHRTAIEIELSPKTTQRLTGILLGYLTSRTYQRVEVRCGSPALQRRVERIVERLGGGAVIEVVAQHG
jgi:hypothetical protein